MGQKNKRTAGKKESGRSLSNLRKKAKGNLPQNTGMIVGICLGALLVLYLGFSIYFQSHFFFRSKVNGADSSGASVETVKERILKNANDYELTIIEKDGNKETIASKDIDLSIDVENGDVERFLKEQNGFAWIGGLFSPVEYKNETIVSYDEGKLKDKVANLNCLTRSDVTETTNATYKYDNGEFAIVDEVYGTNLDPEDFTARVADAATTLADTLDLEKDKVYVQPTVTAEDKTLNNLVKQMNDKMNVDVTYTIGSQTEKVPKEEIAGWLTSTDGKTVSYNDEKMAEFVHNMGKKYNTFGQPKSLHASNGTDVTVPGGNYGWKIDEEGEVAKLKEELDAGKDVSRDFVYQYTAHSHDGNDYGNSYVEINLTAQTVYLYENGALVTSTPCVTGNISKGNGTPAGAFQITYTDKDAVLRGANYESEVSYWMPFRGNVGMHDATWRKKFGGTIYKTGGSHGCVNLPLSAAKTIFGHVEKGFPVLVYSLGGTETETVADANSLAKEVMDKISAIGEPVTLDSEGAITAARGAYDGLNDEAKALVTNLSTLETAEATLANLKNQPLIPTTPALDPAAQAQADAAAQAAAAQAQADAAAAAAAAQAQADAAAAQAQADAAAAAAATPAPVQ